MLNYLIHKFNSKVTVCFQGKIMNHTRLLSSQMLHSRWFIKMPQFLRSWQLWSENLPKGFEKYFPGAKRSQQSKSQSKKSSAEKGKF